MRTSRRLAGRAVALAAVAASCYVVLEGTAWLVKPPLYPYNPHTRYVEETPNLKGSPRFEIVTNNYGFRSPADFSLPLRPGRPRILLIGDSLIFGVCSRGIDYFLAGELADHEVINGGAPATDVRFYYEMLDEYLDPISPDRVFVGLFLGNDFATTLPEQTRSLRYRWIQLRLRLFPQTVALVTRLRVQRGARVGRDELTLLAADAFRERTIQEVRRLAKGICVEAEPLARRAAGFDYGRLLSKHPTLRYSKYVTQIAYAIILRDHLAEAVLLDRPEAVEGYETALREVDAIVDLVRRRRPATRLTFMLFPVSFMVDARYAEYYRDLGYVVPPAAPDYPLYVRLRGDLARRGYDVLDLHESLRDTSVFFDHDWHLNEAGNRWVASEIARRVRGE